MLLAEIAQLVEHNLAKVCGFKSRSEYRRLWLVA